MSQIRPIDLGLPEKFSSWRPGQYEAVERTVEAERRFVVQPAPTGFGKSVYAVGVAALYGGRGLVLTATKNLQNQYQAEFPEIRDIRGRGNYTCVKRDRHGASITCADGQHAKCKDAGCPYKADQQAFLNAPLCITNYAYYLSSIIHSEGVGDVDVLILDEAHAAIEQLCDALQVRLDHTRLFHVYRAAGIYLPHCADDLKLWREWANQAKQKVQAHFDSLKASEETRGIAEVHRLLTAVSRIATAPDHWIVQHSETETIFTPLWPSEEDTKLLFGSADLVLIVSATVVPKTLDLLKVPQADCLTLPAVFNFNPARCPVYIFGSCYVDHRMSDAQFQELVCRMDSLISRRLDRKGTIHTVSYDRQERIVASSEYSQYMLAPHGTTALASLLRTFRESLPPRLLISPSISTGIDLPGSDCEYQFIVKMPVIDRRSPIIAARSKSDPEYIPHLTAQEFMQMCGRAMRADWDQCENFVLDLYARNYIRRAVPTKRGYGYQHLFADWFLKLIRYPNGQPQPPPALASQKLQADVSRIENYKEDVPF